MSQGLKTPHLCKARVESGPNGHFVVSPADPYVLRMGEEKGESLLILAACALRKDPMCIEAHLLLSKHSPDEVTRLRHLKVAVKAGEHLWEPIAAKNGGPIMCWQNPGIRPFMRAIQELGDALAEAGNTAGAEFCYTRLQSMGPGFAPTATDCPRSPGLAVN